MFATLDTRNHDELASEPALVEAYALRRLGDNRAFTLALWTTTVDTLADEVDAYEVEAEQPGAATDESAPALLTGPDRVDVHHTTAHTVAHEADRA